MQREEILKPGCMNEGKEYGASLKSCSETRRSGEINDRLKEVEMFLVDWREKWKIVGHRQTLTAGV